MVEHNVNLALSIKNWSDGGRNYVLKGNPKNKWVGFQATVLQDLIEKFGNNFNIVIWTDPHNEQDYYCIPFSEVEYLFTEEHKTTGNLTNRWTAIILNHRFMMHSSSQFSVDISKHYKKQFLSQPTIEVLEDYFIENAKAEINIRIGQSKFRNGVLKNFDYKCALTEIEELPLLNASHIIPWAHKKECRGDISNGICLYVEYDYLFDKGFISFTDDLKVIITPNIKNISAALSDKLKFVENKVLKSPKNKAISLTYLDYHRKNIFKQ